jgi:hypothetical protein
MKEEQKEQLADAVKEIQVLAIQNPKAGAKYLYAVSDKALSNDFIENLYKSLRETFKDSQADMAEQMVTALKLVREGCLKDADVVAFVKEQADNMVEIGARQDFFRKNYVEKGKKDKSCGIL